MLTDRDGTTHGAASTERRGASGEVRLRHESRDARGGGETRQGIDCGPHGNALLSLERMEGSISHPRKSPDLRGGICLYVASCKDVEEHLKGVFVKEHPGTIVQKAS